MSEMYNRTMLYSGSAGTSACALSESVANFQFYEIVSTGGHTTIIPSKIGSSLARAKFKNSYQNGNSFYLDWPEQFTLTNSGTQLKMKNFQILQQSGSAAPQLRGSATYHDDNMKAIRSVWGLNRVSGSATTVAGSPLTGAGWRPYDCTLIGSASTYVSSFTLTEPASAFSRIMVRAGLSTESPNCREFRAPSRDSAYITVEGYWGNNDTTNTVCFAKYGFFSGTTVLSSIMGKTFALGFNSAEPWTGTGSTANENYRYRPVFEVYGINRK